jgi:hypothetical protein
MRDYEKKRLETELKNFTSRNFERPGDCRNLDQIRYYVKELCNKIEEYEMRFNYVPNWAYSLLAQYNLVQNRMLHVEFVTTYPPGRI